MNNPISPENEETLTRLLTILDYAEGFTLLFARCNVPVLRLQLTVAAKERGANLGIRVIEVGFDAPVQNLRYLLRDRLAQEQMPSAPMLTTPTLEPALAVHEQGATYHARPKVVVFITGLEYSIPFDNPNPRLLAELNLGREFFQRDTPHPVVFWLPDYAITAVARHAPDFWSWRSGVFEFVSEGYAREQMFSHLIGGKDELLAVLNLSQIEKLQRRTLLVNLLEDYASLPSDTRTQLERAHISQELGLLNDALGDLQQAIQYYDQALVLYDTEGYHNKQIMILYSLGWVYIKLKESKKAINYLEKALSLAQLVGNQSNEAAILNYLGSVYGYLNQPKKALTYLENALLLSQTINDIKVQTDALANIGGIYDDLDETDKALDYYEQALELERQEGYFSGQAMTLYNMGIIYAKLDDKQTSVQYFQQGLQLCQQIGDHWVERRIRYGLARVYLALGDLVLAEAQLQQVVLISQSLSHPDLEQDKILLRKVQKMQRQ